ncbi:MAG: sulfotransferase [bacterium]|nr:sulfotransferase [bacterium]
MERQPTIVYITSRGHSGSTLLDLLLGSHSAITSVGEIMNLSPLRQESRGRKRGIELQPVPEGVCTCGATPVNSCEFWAGVAAEARRVHGSSIWDLDLVGREDYGFPQNNRILFNSVQAVSGSDIIVDSSKNIERLERLLEDGTFDVRPIHLIRSPHGVVHSNVRRGRSWSRHAFIYTRATMRARELLHGHDHFKVRYEKMVVDPEGTLRAVMAWLGLNFEATQLKWADAIHHNLGGNNMRLSNDSSIRLDESWRRGLSAFRKVGVTAMTLPTRFPGVWTYPAIRALWKISYPIRRLR